MDVWIHASSSSREKARTGTGAQQLRRVRYSERMQERLRTFTLSSFSWFYRLTSPVTLHTPSTVSTGLCEFESTRSHFDIYLIETVDNLRAMAREAIYTWAHGRPQYSRYPLPPLHCLYCTLGFGPIKLTWRHTFLKESRAEEHRLWRLCSRGRTKKGQQGSRYPLPPSTFFCLYRLFPGSAGSALKAT